MRTIGIFGNRRCGGSNVGATRMRGIAKSAIGLAAAVAVLSVVVWTPRLWAAPGNVLSEQKISDTSGGFPGILADGDFFGSSVAPIGDLDGNGVTDIAVGAIGDDDGGSLRGAVWLLWLTTSGTVSSTAKISDTAGGFLGALSDGDLFGSAVAGLGDLDGDGVADLAIGAPRDDDGGTDRGAVWIVFLNPDGSVKAFQKISDTAGGFSGTLDNGDWFGGALSALGDLDGDGVEDLAVGAPFDDDGGTDRGAVWVLFLNPDGTVKSDAKLSDVTPGFGGALADFDSFGSAVATMRDLDGDSHVELAVGATGDSEVGLGRGAVWVLFLDATAGIKTFQKINQANGGFSGTLDDGDQFGFSIGAVRDELAVGAPNDDDGAVVNGGAVWMLLMNANGTVKVTRKISASSGGFVGPLHGNDNLGTAAVMARDVDGDGVADLIGGARRDDDGGLDRGALWVLFLDGVPGAFCGDGVLDPGEQCDDGNNIDGDCCSSNCTLGVPGSSCADGDLCNGDEVCDGSGNCVPGTPLDCNDGDPCTQDSCDALLGCQSVAGPAPVCLSAGKVVVEIRDKANDASDKIKWKWRKGDETLLADLGDPTSTTGYALCIYDETASTPSLVGKIVIPPGPFWQNKGAKGFKYVDKLATFDGAKRATLRPGAAGRAKVDVFAKGVNVPMPVPAGPGVFFNQDPNVTIQLLNDAGVCWTSEFVSPALKNDASRFKDKTLQ